MKQLGLNSLYEKTDSKCKYTLYYNNQIANFACDVMAAMLVMNNKNISLLWELNSIFT